MTQSEVTDYKTLIDEQTWAFIKLTDSYYPPDTTDFSLERQRDNYNKLCRHFNRGYPDGVTATDATIPAEDYDVPVRRYTSAAKKDSALIVYFHGGGFVVGGLDSHDDICAELCTATGFDVTAVDYRLAPEHVHPAEFNDALASVIHEYERTGTPVLLCGDSAGGNLAAGVSHIIRDNPKHNANIIGQVLIYPALGGDTTKGSYIRHANAPMLTTSDIHFYFKLRTGQSGTSHQSDTDNCKAGSDNGKQVSLAPLTDSNFSQLPDTVAFSAECDPLADDSKHYVEAINSAGGNATWINEEGLVHGYLRARSSVDRAADSFNRIVDSLSQLGSKA